MNENNQLVNEIVDTINELYGCDAMYHGVDSHAIAVTLVNKGFCRQNNWKAVTTDPPKESGKYFVCTKAGKVFQARYYSSSESSGEHWGMRDKGKSITYWMPLPSPPKVE